MLQQETILEVRVTNPTDGDITLEVQMSGHGLRGQPAMTLGPRQCLAYEVLFAPTIAGEHQGWLELTYVLFVLKFALI